ncbi:MAG: hypothetical protein EBZ48_08655 [Proteobacteria bacterium]|nr:hypothetical protein [Pseudomonadota bacterium]
MVVSLVRDLVFGSKIDAVLNTLGVEQHKIRSHSDISALPSESTIRAGIINLGIPGDEAFLCAQLLLQRNIPVYCYYPHVETDLLARAKLIGVTEAYPRGSFLEHLKTVFR